MVKKYLLHIFCCCSTSTRFSPANKIRIIPVFHRQGCYSWRPAHSPRALTIRNMIDLCRITNLVDRKKRTFRWETVLEAGYSLRWTRLAEQPSTVRPEVRPVNLKYWPYQSHEQNVAGVGYCRFLLIKNHKRKITSGKMEKIYFYCKICDWRSTGRATRTDWMNTASWRK